MNFMRTSKYVLATLAIASLAAFGCGKDGASGEAGKALGKAGFGVLPKDVNLVVGINPTSITSSQLYKDLVEPQVQKNGGEELNKIKTKCDIDPTTAFKQIMLGLKLNDSMEPDEDNMFILVSGVSRDKGEKCLETLSKEEAAEPPAEGAEPKKEIKLTREGNVTKVEGDKEPFYIGWIDDTTAVTGGPKMDKATLEARMAGKDGLDTNKELMGMLGKTNQSASVWMAMIKPQGASAPMPIEFSAVYGSVDLASGLNVNAGMRQASADEAKKTVDMAKGQIEAGKAQAEAFGVGELVNKLTIESQESDVVVKLALSDAELKSLVEKLKPMMGMFGM